MSTALAKVERFIFDGDALDVVPGDGAAHVIIKRVCEVLGVAFEAQLRNWKGAIMTKRKPGAVRGRPKGSGAGLDVKAWTAITSEVAALLDAHAEALGTDRSGAIRLILTRWAKRQPKGATR
jgi:hypothetical protein